MLIVEGLRHPEAVDALHARLPMRERLLVYLEIDSDRRRQRLTQTGDMGDILSHEVERKVNSLRATANIVVSAEQPTDELVQLVCRLMMDG